MSGTPIRDPHLIDLARWQKITVHLKVTGKPVESRLLLMIAENQSRLIVHAAEAHGLPVPTEDQS